eukprot:scaffold16284_cov56-Phaeocystis_antarctica.AAC.5
MSTSAGAAAGMRRAALPSPRLRPRMPAGLPRAWRIAAAATGRGARAGLEMLRGAVTAGAAGAAGAARLAVMPRAALHALGGAGGPALLGVVALLAVVRVLYRRRGGVAVASAASAARETAGARSRVEAAAAGVGTAASEVPEWANALGWSDLYAPL